MKNSSADFLIKTYSWILKAGNLTQLLLLLFFRINWGWLFFVTGKGKLLNHTQVVSFFNSLHLPAADTTAWFVAIIECFGGLLLILGLATRPVGLLLSINMIVAYLSVEEDRNKLLNFFGDQNSFFQADPFFFLLAALMAFAFGGGPFSLDAILEKIVRKFDQHSI
jgi:putative oxidoreductase